MRYPTLMGVLSVGVTLLVTSTHAATCANGVYRAGCAGPNGAAVVRKPATVQPYHYVPRTTTCANGVYRAGCAGPNGAAVVRKPPY
jgi:hypothetical protein